MVTYEDLKYTTSYGQEAYLPTWYLLRSAEEIEEAKTLLINAEPAEEVNEEFVIEDREFTSEEFAEIEAMIACGYTFDAACQRQLLKERS